MRLGDRGEGGRSDDCTEPPPERAPHVQGLWGGPGEGRAGPSCRVGSEIRCDLWPVVVEVTFGGCASSSAGGAGGVASRGARPDHFECNAPHES